MHVQYLQYENLKKNTNIWKEYAKRAIILEIHYIDINKDDFS